MSMSSTVDFQPNSNPSQPNFSPAKDMDALDVNTSALTVELQLGHNVVASVEKRDGKLIVAGLHPGGPRYTWHGSPDLLAEFMLTRFNRAFPHLSEEHIAIVTSFGWMHRVTAKTAMLPLTMALRFLHCLQLDDSGSQLLQHHDPLLHGGDNRRES